MADPVSPSRLTVAAVAVRQRLHNLPIHDAAAARATAVATIMLTAAIVVLLAVTALLGGVAEALALGLAGFVSIVAVHELGYLATAKFFGVPVERFAIGIPPSVDVVATLKDLKPQDLLPAPGDELSSDDVAWVRILVKSDHQR